MKPISILLFVLLSLSATAQSQLPYGQVFLPADSGGSICPNTLKTIAHISPHVAWNGTLPAFDCTTAGLKYGGTLTGEVGQQSYTAWIVWKRTAVAGDVFVPLARYSTNPKASFIVKRSKANLELMYVTDSGVPDVRAVVHDGTLHVYPKYGFARDNNLQDHTSYFTFPCFTVGHGSCDGRLVNECDRTANTED